MPFLSRPKRKRTSPARPGNRLRVENLEHRLLLAGNISARVLSGDLIIRGDPRGNEFEITPGSSSGQLEITGLTTGDSRTSVNHRAAVTIDGVSGRIVIRSRGGDDRIRLSRLSIPGDVVVQSHWGDDAIEIVESAVRDIRIATGRGADLAHVEGTTVRGKMRVRTSRQSDTVSVVDSVIDQELSVATQRGRDQVRLVNTSANGAEITTRTSSDRVCIQDSSFGDLTVNLGRGADRIDTTRLQADRASIQGDFGNDLVAHDDADSLGSFQLGGFERSATPVPCSPEAGLTISVGENVSVPAGESFRLTEDILSLSGHDAPNEVVYSLADGGFSGLFAGHVALTDAPNTPITSFTHEDLVAGRVIYRDGGDGRFVPEIRVDRLTVVASDARGNETEPIGLLLQRDLPGLSAQDETIIWRPGDGSSSIDGGEGDDAFVFYGGDNAHQVLVRPTDDGAGVVVTTADETVELDGIEDLYFLLGSGVNQLDMAGDFTGTDLSPTTIFVQDNDFRDQDSTPDGISVEFHGDVILHAGGGNNDVRVVAAGIFATGGEGRDAFRLFGQATHQIQVFPRGTSPTSPGNDLGLFGNQPATNVHLEDFSPARWESTFSGIHFVDFDSIDDARLDPDFQTVLLERNQHSRDLLGSFGNSYLVHEPANDLPRDPSIGPGPTGEIQAFQTRFLYDSRITTVQVDTLRPGNVDAGDEFFVSFNGDCISFAAAANPNDCIPFTATEASVSSVTSGITQAWNQPHPDRPSIASITNTTAVDQGTHVALVGDSPGQSFVVATVAAQATFTRATLLHATNTPIPVDAYRVVGVGSVDPQRRNALIGTTPADRRELPLFEDLQGADLDDIIFAGDSATLSDVDFSSTAFTLGDRLFGGGGDDWLVGDRRDNILNGETGDDHMEGRRGEDTFPWSIGDDLLDGGDDLDTASYESDPFPLDAPATRGSSISVTATGTGRYEVEYHRQDQTTGDIIQSFVDSLVSVETIIGSARGDRFAGGAAADRFFGGPGNDEIDGGPGSDLVDGGEGQDLGLFQLANTVDQPDQYIGGDGFDTLRVTISDPLIVTDDIKSDLLQLQSRFATASLFPILNLQIDGWEAIEFVDRGGNAIDVASLVVSQPPSDITVSSLTVPEQSLGAVVGELRVIDPDNRIGDSHTLTISDPRFVVRPGNQLGLTTSESLTFATEPVVDLTIRATDRAGNSLEKAFTIEVVELLKDVLPTSRLQLNGTNGFEFTHVFPNGVSGETLEAAGDLNADGFQEIVTTSVIPNGITRFANFAFVLPGGPAATATRLFRTDLPSLGGTTLILPSSDSSQRSVAATGIGDFNGDGFDDLLLGAGKSESSDSSFEAGQAMIVFGRAGGLPDSIDLTDDSVFDGTRALRIEGGNLRDRLGYTVEHVGDVDGDGLNDALIGLGPPSQFGSGGALIVYGTTAAIAPSQTTDNLGLRVTQIESGIVESIGDVNGDGNDDLFVGLFTEDENGAIILGGPNLPQTVDPNLDHDVLIRTGDNRGVKAFPGIGGRAGDINSDGFEDLFLILSTETVPTEIHNELVVLYGGALPGVIDLGDNTGNGPNGASNIPFLAGGSRGVQILPGGDFGRSGPPDPSFIRGVTGGGDVNGDGNDDLLLRVFNTATALPEHIVVFGGPFLPESFVLDPATLNTRQAIAFGFSVTEGHQLDQGLALVDSNADNFHELVLADPLATIPFNPTPVFESLVYVLFGGNLSSLVNRPGSDIANFLLGESTTDDIFVGRAGDDTLIGLGGRDVYYGGIGNDLIALRGAGIPEYVRIDGGSGIDTVRIDGNDLIWDLRTTGNSNTNAAGNHLVESIEIIDLRSGGDDDSHELILGIDDLADLPKDDRSLTILGDSSDTVTLITGGGGGLTFERTELRNGISLDIYSVDELANFELAVTDTIQLIVGI